MQQTTKNKNFSDLSKKELMEFILTLNKCMQTYEMNIENRMNFSEKIELESIKQEPISYRSLKRVQSVRNIKR